MFCQFQPGVACKSVAYKKSVYMKKLKTYASYAVLAGFHENYWFTKWVFSEAVTLGALNIHNSLSWFWEFLTILLKEWKTRVTPWSKTIILKKILA